MKIIRKTSLNIQKNYLLEYSPQRQEFPVISEKKMTKFIVGFFHESQCNIASLLSSSCVITDEDDVWSPEKLQVMTSHIYIFFPSTDKRITCKDNFNSYHELHQLFF